MLKPQRVSQAMQSRYQAFEGHRAGAHLRFFSSHRASGRRRLSRVQEYDQCIADPTIRLLINTVLRYRPRTDRLPSEPEDGSTRSARCDNWKLSLEVWRYWSARYWMQPLTAKRILDSMELPDRCHMRSRLTKTSMSNAPCSWAQKSTCDGPRVSCSFTDHSRLKMSAKTCHCYQTAAS